MNRNNITAVSIIAVLLASVLNAKASSMADQLNEIDAQIQTAQTTIERIKLVPVEHGPTLIIIGTSISDPNPDAEQLIKMLSEKEMSLQFQLFDAMKENEAALAQKNSVPVEFMASANALEYMLNEKVALLLLKLGDVHIDISFVIEGVRSQKRPSRLESQYVINRKIDVLKETVAFLKKQKKFIQGQDPRYY